MRRLTRACAGLAVLAVLLWTTVGTPAATRWTRLRTAHFEIAGDVGERQLKQVGFRFEQFRETFARLFPGMREAPAPVVIVVFGSKRAYQPYMPLFNGKRVDVGGYFLARPDVNYITLTLDGGDDAYRVVFHEYTHLLVNSSVQDVPTWFNEGLAEYYSTFEASSDGRNATIGRIVTNHVLQLREQFIPLGELLAVEHDSPLYNEGDRRSIFYAESWALTHYLLVGRDERRPQLAKYLALYSAGTPGDQAFREAFQADISTIERELRNYVGQSIYQSMRYNLRDPVEVDRATRTEPMTEADGTALLGDILLHFRRLDEAASHLERALALDAGHVRATAALGRVRHLQGRDEEGRKLLAQASSRAGDDYLPHYYYATTVLRPEVGAGAEVPTPDRAVAEQATTLLDKVVALTPGMADAHALLGYGRLVCGQPVPSAAALAKAYAISPRSEYALMAAQAYIAARDFKAARKTLGPLVARGDSPEIRQSARDMLGYLVSIEHPAPGSPPVPPATGAPGGPPATAEANVIPIYREVRPGETREKGTLTEIACGRNGIVLTVAGSTREVRLGVARFEDVAFISYRTDLTGGISCGRRASPERVYATWRDGGPAGTDGLAVAIEFLPLTDR